MKEKGSRLINDAAMLHVQAVDVVVNSCQTRSWVALVTSVGLLASVLCDTPCKHLRSWLPPARRIDFFGCSLVVLAAMVRGLYCENWALASELRTSIIRALLMAFVRF